MTYDLDQQVTGTARVRRLLIAALAFGCAFGTVPHASAQKIPSPATPTLITPPEGNVAYLLGRAKGTQGYICLPKDGSITWTAKPSRPEATLFTSILGQDVQIITHFLSPDEKPNGVAPDPLPFGSATWQSSLDSSKVWAQVLHSNSIVPSPEITSCPNTGSIACLLLETIGTEAGPTGGKFLTKTTFVQRLNTKGGSAPPDSDGCSGTADIGNQRLVGYTADYYFFRKDE